MVDESAVIRSFLAGKPELLALVGQRIYAEADTPAAGYQPSQGPAICFKRRGGRGDYEYINLFPSYQFKLYGAMGAQFQATSPQLSANALYRTLFDVFNYQFGYQIKSTELEVPGQMLTEPQTDWIYVLCFYKLQVLNP